MAAIEELDRVPTKIKPQEAKLAKPVIETFEGELDLKEYRDEYQAELRRVIDAKIRRPGDRHASGGDAGEGRRPDGGAAQEPRRRHAGKKRSRARRPAAPESRGHAEGREDREARRWRRCPLAKARRGRRRKARPWVREKWGQSPFLRADGWHGGQSSRSSAPAAPAQTRTARGPVPGPPHVRQQVVTPTCFVEVGAVQQPRRLRPGAAQQQGCRPDREPVGQLLDGPSAPSRRAPSCRACAAAPGRQAVDLLVQARDLVGGPKRRGPWIRTMVT